MPDKLTPAQRLAPHLQELRELTRAVYYAAEEHDWATGRKLLDSAAAAVAKARRALEKAEAADA